MIAIRKIAVTSLYVAAGCTVTAAAFCVLGWMDHVSQVVAIVSGIVLGRSMENFVNWLKLR